MFYEAFAYKGPTAHTLHATPHGYTYITDPDFFIH